MTAEILKPVFSRESAQAGEAGTDGLPMWMELASTPYAVIEISEDGFAVLAYDGEAEPGQVVQTTLVVSLDGLRLSLPALWEVTAHFADRTRLSLLLSAANTPASLDRMRSVIRAVLAGDLAGSTHVLEIVGRKSHDGGPAHSPAGGRNPAKTKMKQALRRRTGAVLFSLLALVLIAFIGWNVISRTLMVTADGTIVNAQAVLARAPENSELVSFSVPVGSRVAPGAPVAVVKTPAGLSTVTSPCDCVVGWELPGRTMVQQNDPLAQLVPVNGVNKAVISVPKKALRRIRVGDRVIASFYDSGASVSGTVERVSPPKVVTAVGPVNNGQNGTVEVRISQRLPAWRVGEPVMARILLSRLNPFA